MKTVVRIGDKNYNFVGNYDPNKRDMKTAEQILAKVTGIKEWMGDTYIVTQLQAVEAMEEYAAQFYPSETQTFTDGIRILPDDKLLKDPKTFFDTYGEIEPPKE